MLLFRSEEHIDRWCAQKELTRGAVLTIDQGWKLAHAWYHNRMSPTYRRKTPEEAEAFFSKLSLTGEFWRLRR